MQDFKTTPARPTFWCGILTAEKQAAAPAQARTVRGVYSSSGAQGAPQDKRTARKKGPTDR